MAIRRTSSKVAYSTNKPLQDLAPLAVAARRGPKPTDLADVATIWVDIVNHDVWIASGFQSGQAQWSRVDNDGGPGEFTSLTINPGPTSLTGEVTLTSGPLNLPFTNSIGLGVINVNNTRFIHNYGTNNNSVFLGLDAGNLTNTAQKNIGIGSDAGKSITSGSDNTFIGHEAGTDNTGGIRNTFVGSSSGSNVVGSAGDSSQNTAVGFSALNLATTGIANTALGSQALRQVGTGDYNIGIGYQGGDSITGSTSSCIFIGNKGSGAGSNTIRIGTFGSGDNEHNNADIIGALQIDTSQNVVVPVGDIKVTAANKGISVKGALSSVASPGTALTANGFQFTTIFAGFTTAAGATETFTILNDKITSVQQMVTLSVARTGGTTGLYSIQGFVLSVGQIVVTIVNNDVGANDGDINIGGFVIG